MASSSRLTREEVLRKKAEDEARRAGTLPAERDAKGRVINPHIPEYMKNAPWYIGNSEEVGLDHQRLPESQKYSSDIHSGWYNRGSKAVVVSSSSVPPAGSKGSGGCANCGASTHTTKNCLERPRKIGAAKIGAKLVSGDDAPQPSLNLSYDGKRDTYNGFDPEAQLKAIQKRSMVLDKLKAESETESTAAKNGEKDLNLPKGSLRVRHDTAKYLLNLNPDSAYYDPKTRSMRANPTPDVPIDQLKFSGDNFVRNSGDVAELERMEAFAALRSSQTSDSSQAVQANPTALSLARKEFEARKERLAAERKKKIEEQYGASAFVAPPPTNLVQASSSYSEYAPDGTVVKGMKAAVALSRYREDVLENNHNQVWGSYFDPHTMSWGYGCCWQTIRSSYCTGEAGKQAAREAIKRARPTENPVETQPKSSDERSNGADGSRQDVAPPATSNSSLYGDSSVSTNFDKEKVEAALKRIRRQKQQENDRSSSSASSESEWSSESDEDDDTKRTKKKHTTKSDRKDKKLRRTETKSSSALASGLDEMSPEELEAHRMIKIRSGDPMADLLGKNDVL